MIKIQISSEPLIFLYTIIFTINYTVLPQLLLQKVCLQRTNFNHTACSNEDNLSDDLQKESAVWWFYLLLCSLVPSVFTVLIWGPITDVIGRKRAMIFVPVINALRSLVYLINAYFMEANVGYMIFGSFLSCFYGEFQGVVALCYSYMADITAENLDERTMRMAFVEAGVFFAGIPAGLLSGYLLEKIGYVSVFTLTIGINACILFYVLFYLPPAVQLTQNGASTKCLAQDEADKEKTPSSCDPLDQKNARILQDATENGMPSQNFGSCFKFLNPVQPLKQVFKVITHRDSRAVVLPLIVAFGFSVCAVLGELIVQTLYLKNHPFQFTSQQIGYYSATQAAIRGVGVILVTQISHHWLRLSDYTLIFVGSLSQILCYALIGLSRSKLVVFLVNIAGLAVPVMTTTLRSLTTKNVTKDHYGAVLASIEATDAIAGVITNALSLWTYNLTLSIYSGVVFFGLSGFSTISFLIVLVTFCRTVGRGSAEIS